MSVAAMNGIASDTDLSATTFLMPQNLRNGIKRSKKKPTKSSSNSHNERASGGATIAAGIANKRG